MTAPDPGPIVQRILLGLALRGHREAAGMTLSEGAKALGWYSSKLSKTEHGDAKLTNDGLANAVRAYGIGRDEARELQVLAVEARRMLPPSRVPDWAAKYVNLMRAAKRVRLVMHDIFPGTIQTGDYAKAILSRSVVLSQSDAERMAEERASRAEWVRSATGTRFSIIVGEEAVLRVVGSREVWHAQLRSVRELAELPHVTVQALPLSGAHSAHGAGFTIVNLLEDRPGIVYVEGLTGSDYLTREHYRVHSLAFDSLTAAALSPDDTMALIDRQLG